MVVVVGGAIGASSSSMANFTMLSTRTLIPNHTKTRSHEKPSLSHLHLPQITRPIKLKPSICRTMSPTSSSGNVHPPEVEDAAVTSPQREKFDWYSQWYPVMPVSDLDKRAPHGKRVMGLYIVVWWDRNESEWKVFNDLCPHRLAPLSEGRIDQCGRLQCVYHGWCFNGSGDCKLIPQAPPDGPPVHTFKKACVAVYPSTVQNGMVWFWPNSDPKFKDILQYQQPPYIPELDDPSYTQSISNRDIPYGYEILIENLMDPSHVPYAHHGLMQTSKPKQKVDREGGRPMEITVKHYDINGFTARQEAGTSRFIAPCIFSVTFSPGSDNTNGAASATTTSKDSSAGASISSQRRFLLIFICIPVSPGKSRLIWSFPRNFVVWIDRIIPKWIFHIRQNLILDSDLYLLHVQEKKIMELGPTNWQKVCFVPTKADVLVVAYRRWLNKYSQGQVDWGGKFNSSALPPTPSREDLFDRYWSHVVNCPSCNAAYKTLNVTETVLQIMSVGLIGVIGLTKQATMSAAQRTSLFSLAILCFAASKWVSHFVYKNFRYHDYSHAFK